MFFFQSLKTQARIEPDGFRVDSRQGYRKSVHPCLFTRVQAGRAPKDRPSDLFFPLLHTKTFSRCEIFFFSFFFFRSLMTQAPIEPGIRTRGHFAVVLRSWIQFPSYRLCTGAPLHMRGVTYWSIWYSTLGGTESSPSAASGN